MRNTARKYPLAQSESVDKNKNLKSIDSTLIDEENDADILQAFTQLLTNLTQNPIDHKDIDPNSIKIVPTLKDSDNIKLITFQESLNDFEDCLSEIDDIDQLRIADKLAVEMRDAVQNRIKKILDIDTKSTISFQIIHPKSGGKTYSYLQAQFYDENRKKNWGKTVRREPDSETQNTQKSNVTKIKSR